MIYYIVDYRNRRSVGDRSWKPISGPKGYQGWKQGYFKTRAQAEAFIRKWKKSTKKSGFSQPNDEFRIRKSNISKPTKKSIPQKNPFNLF